MLTISGEGMIMGKAGRPRKMRHRYKTGRLMADPRAAARREAKSVVLSARCRHLGVSATWENQDKLDDQLMFDGVGRLRKLRRITEPQYDAARKYAEGYASYLRANGTHGRFAKASALERVSGQPMPVEHDNDGRRVKEFEEAQSALRKSGLKAFGAVEDACLEDRKASLFSLRVGLTALALHYGLIKHAP